MSHEARVVTEQFKKFNEHRGVPWSKDHAAKLYDRARELYSSACAAGDKEACERAAGRLDGE